MCIDKLDGIVNTYNNSYHSTIKINPVNVKSSTQVFFSIENKNKDLKLKVG